MIAKAKVQYGELVSSFNAFKADFYKFEFPRLKRKGISLKCIVSPTEVRKGKIERKITKL